VPLSFAQIPNHDRPPAAVPATPSTALRAMPLTGRRRTVLKGMALGALTLGAAALDWSGVFRGRPARAETGPFSLAGWDRNDCRDAYPSGYPESGDTSGGYVNTYPACFGGSWRGSNYCDAGWHKYGTWTENGIQVDHVPISSACGTVTTKNAWRWTTPDGHVYRCSDGFSTFWGGPNSGQTFLTICRASG
jgi:hypothetical protein